jgi:hypothetical protein
MNVGSTSCAPVETGIYAVTPYERMTVAQVDDESGLIKDQITQSPQKSSEARPHLINGVFSLICWYSYLLMT